MKAAVYREYGSPDVLEYADVQKPTPTNDEVLVDVRASSINHWDWELLRGKPITTRLSGPFGPSHTVLGADVAGRVRAVGDDVTQFQPGDDVWGDLCESGWGAFAEYACAREDALAPKPDGVSYEQAASVPQAGTMALQGLGDVRAGQRVLINGAGGGVGTIAVQLADAVGAEVTGVDRAEKLDAIRSLGADHVVDYTQDDVTSADERYDLVLDVVGNRSVFDWRRVVGPGGRYVMVGGTTARIAQTVALGPVLSRFGSRHLGLLIARPNEGLDRLGDRLDDHTLSPVVDRRFTLEAVPDAFRYYEAGRFVGKIVVTVA